MVWKLINMFFASVLLSFCKDAGKVAIETAQSALSAPQQKGITLFLCGDVMTGRGIDQILPASVDPVIYEPYVKDARDYVRLAERVNGAIPRQVSYNYIWGDAMDVWQNFATDLKIINLETSITTYDIPWPGKPIQYRMHPQNAAVLTAAKIDFCSLANNHVLDWERPGLLETLQSLQKAGMPYAGAGKNEEEAQKLAILKVKAGRVIILAYGSGTSGIPETWAAAPRQSGVNLLPDFSDKTINLIKEQVMQVKQPGDIVVFTIHWGGNWGYDITPRQREFAHKLIDNAGVDVIHGHSSHHPLGIEVYRDKLIIYGAGDFINDYEGIMGHELYRGDLTLMYFPLVDPVTGHLASLKMVPMQIRNFRLNYASGSDGKWLSIILNREGLKFGTSVIQDEDGSLLLQW